ncbi:MAG: DNA-formamidopyrimidine glycosylase [Desulfuromonas sp.]|nr:MAG: DNA-formamidopyrimidine glycosylase [Desulfuromonas sp.]
MPELPEVETTRHGIEPLLVGHSVQGVVVRQASLRRPVPDDLSSVLIDQVFVRVRRRAKYLLLGTNSGTLLIHLGMSGSLRVVPAATPAEKHDHVDLVLDDGQLLRYRDARRFGLLQWCAGDPLEHELLTHLGPEPLGSEFDGLWLKQQAARRRVAVKAFLMDQRVVVGVGNIYASEALFMAGISPSRAAGNISLPRYQRLADAVKRVLLRAIAEGGTTLRDFTDVDGRPGYFSQSLQVYGRSGEPCTVCGHEIHSVIIGQRSSFYCPQCQR